MLVYTGQTYLTCIFHFKQIMSLVKLEKYETISEKTKVMLNNHRCSDVKFLVRESVDGRRKQVLPAHKFVLAIGSPVFEAMFYSDLAETKDTIELPDCDYGSLLELFRFMYSDEVNLSGSNVMGVLYLATKYEVSSLSDKCTEYLKENVDSSNVLSILPCAQTYDKESLEEECWKVIDEHTEAVVKSDDFVTIQRSLLEAVVKRDTLNIAEVELFKGLMRWATKKLEKEGIVRGDGQEIREILGERMVKSIRFPAMEWKNFASVVLDTKILTFDEVSAIIKHQFNLKQSSLLNFPVFKRSGPSHSQNPESCCRFTRSSMKFGWNNSGTDKTYLGISVDRDIIFHGVKLFGSRDNTYSVSLSLIKDLGGKVLASVDGVFSSPSCATGASDYDFVVTFKEPALLRKGDEYELECRISGPQSWYGTEGRQTICCHGVTFFLKDTSVWYSSLRTNSKQGQIKEFIYSLIPSKNNS